MHRAVTRFIRAIKAEHPELFFEKKVLECGSRDVNGTPRPFFEQCEYIGVDNVEGEGVDVRCFFHVYNEKPAGYFDVVISTETFEHDPYFELSIRKALDMLRVGGSLIITCAGPKRGVHGKAKYTPDGTAYYRGVEPGRFLYEIYKRDFFMRTVFSMDRNAHDLFFFGYRRRLWK